MTLTKDDLIQLIREAMEAGEVGPDVEGSESAEDDSEGKIHIKARLRTDDAFKAAQEDAEKRGAGQNTFQMAEYVVTLPDGEEIIIPDNDTFEKMQDERAIQDAFTLATGRSLQVDRRGYNLPSEETKIEGFTGISQPGGVDEDGNLLDRELGDFQVFIDGFKIPKQGAASDELIKAFKKYKGKKPTYRTRSIGGVSKRKDTDEERFVDRQRRYYANRRYEEGKLTKDVLKQMIREELKDLI